MIEPYFQDESVTLYLARTESVLPTLPNSSVDLIVTDPPYFRVKGEWWDRQWDSRDGFLAWLGGLCDEWRRVLKPNGSLYVFASPDMAWHVEGAVRERFNVLNHIRWVKEDGWHQKTEKEDLRSFLSPWEAVIFAEHYPALHDATASHESKCDEIRGRVYEPLRSWFVAAWGRAGISRAAVDDACGTSNVTQYWFLPRNFQIPTAEKYATLRRMAPHAFTRDYDDLRQEYEALRRDYEYLRRPFALTDRAEWSDVWRFKTVAARYGKHPCEKPIALAEHIVRSSSRPGAVVLDCFAGTGAFLVAARNLSRAAVGVEVDERHCRTIAARLAQAVLPLDIPA